MCQRKLKTLRISLGSIRNGVRNFETVLLDTLQNYLQPLFFPIDKKLDIFVSKIFLAAIYLLKVRNKNTRTRCEICSKLTIKISERRLAIGVVLVSILLTLNIFHTLFCCFYC